MEWSRGPIIGRGSSATVFLAADASSGELFAVKSAEFSDSGLLQKEKSILSQLDSPHVIKCLGFDITCEENKVMYNVLLEYVSGGTLCDVVKKLGSCVSEPMIRFCAREVLLGIEYLHSKGIVHCDLKGRNVLVSEDGAVKIADLGCAKLVGNGGVVSSGFSGTPAFMAPEVARGEEQGFAADIWAFGCTIIEMASGSSPWPEMDDPVSALYRIGYSEDAVPEFPGWISGEAKDFLSKCLNRNAKDRWSATELLHHPFLQNPNSNPEKLEILPRNSPTSVIDQGFWESIEPSKSPVPASPVDPPANRIGRLIGSSTFPDWEDDEQGWVNVRGIIETVNLSPIEKTDKTIFQTDCNLDQEDEDELMEVEPFLFPEDLECLRTGNGGFLFDFFAEKISFSSRLGTTINIALSHENVKHQLSLGIQTFMKNMIKISYLMDSHNIIIKLLIRR
ncbi:mitogen-activated protein kinase kinase kinase 18-like [Ipomoea triloba]|uniref:mitogen-activated protein kinase kinase kinase 18-like n=1 Tax=Ipomoea triloba TaxID=35885 RepID=UPI00125D3C59|nr:mitogen-activated protein kinase kinase kinase 18-like [Ipomoea triloba]